MFWGEDEQLAGAVGRRGLVLSRAVRTLQRINAETQRFAEKRRERRKKEIFSSAFLRALCVSALKLGSSRLCGSLAHALAEWIRLSPGPTGDCRAPAL